LGELSPVGRLLTTGKLSKITKVAQKFGLLFSAVKKHVLILRKKWIGLHFGRFFTNSSGHPA
jgi:hypothetical protein